MSGNEMTIPCQKEAILTEMKLEHDALRKTMEKRLQDGELRFQQIMDKLLILPALVEQVGTMNKRMYVDNGTDSIQTTINNNKLAIVTHAGIMKWQLRVITSIIIAIILSFFAAVASHMGWIA